MEIPDYEPFYLETAADLRAEIVRLGLDLPLADDLHSLRTPLDVGARRVVNRFCLQPMSGLDARADGSPGELTARRYQRYAAGGFGLIWIESTAAGSAGATGQLVLCDANREAFRAWIESIRAQAAEHWQHEIVMVLQLNASVEGAVQQSAEAADGTPLIGDSEIERCRDLIVAAAALAAELGIDGVDVQSCHGALAGNLLGAFERDGCYGGSFENRTRLLRETLQGIREAAPQLLLATRLSAYDAVRRPHGFGVDPSDYRKADFSEPAELARELRQAGLDLLNVTTSSPNLRGAAALRPFAGHSDCAVPDEHPLMVLDRQLRAAREMREAAPELTVIGSGFSWLRQFVPQVAAAAIDGGAMDLVGLGRSALADPQAPARFMREGNLRPEATCMVCFACSTLLEDGGPVGCVIRDAEAYGKSWQETRRFATDRLEEEARRCHFCESAPCVSACPAHVDVPAFIKAWLGGDERRAYEIIRASDVLPEMTSHLSPAWLQGEGACIETALTGRPVPILDLQYAISWQARQRGETGARLAEGVSGKRVAIVGAGPAGIAAAARLVECGHQVDLYEGADRLGGTPQRVIPSSRVPDFSAEIDALLGPAIDSGRLCVHFNKVLGNNLAMDSLCAAADAVLLAVGLWREAALPSAGDVDGIVGALTYLEQVKAGELVAVADRVAVLAGGDSAMDAAETARRLGARDVFVVFGGPRSTMHWHMPEEWFASPGVHAMMQCRPLGYEVDDQGKLRGLQLDLTELGTESLLAVDLVIEAMGLELAGEVSDSLAGLDFTEDGRIETGGGFHTSVDRVYAVGAMVNGGASVGQCVAEGMKAAEVIHADLS